MAGDRRTSGRAEGSAYAPSPLLLAPAAASNRRLWHVGRRTGFDRDAVVLPLTPSSGSFVSLRDVWPALAPGFRDRRGADFRRLDGYVQASRDGGSFGLAGPSLALRRRISRESGPATRAVELGARLLLEGVAATYPGRTIVVPRVDEVDSLTLRTLARSAILHTDAHGLTFQFHSTVDPRRPHATSLADLSRTAILLNASRYGDFTYDVGDVGPLPTRPVDPSPLSQAAVDLVAHNYEAALMACAAMPETSEALRLSALAAVNLGALDEAGSLLRRAVDVTPDPGARAHLHCLLALVTTKRRNDLVASEAFIDKGLRVLDRHGGGSSDEAIERAWLLNARALNRALEYRRTNDLSCFHAAHDLEIAASRLVADGNSPERTYLRMNLLANIAFLWEIMKRPDNAIRVFEQVFEKRMTADQLAWATLGYRLAVLHVKAGSNDRAARVLADVTTDLPPEEWCVADHLLRVRIRVAVDTGRLDEAEALARRGYALAQETRSYAALVAHSQALVQVFTESGRGSQTDDLVEQLAGLGISREALHAPSPLRPKLPSYIPEIDLEDIPLHDTNTRLSVD